MRFQNGALRSASRTLRLNQQTVSAYRLIEEIECHWAQARSGIADRGSLCWRRSSVAPKSGRFEADTCESSVEFWQAPAARVLTNLAPTTLFNVTGIINDAASI